MMSQVLSPSKRSASFNSIDSNRMGLGLTFVYSNNAFCLEKETDLVVSEDTHAGVQSQAAEPWNTQSHHGSPPIAKVHNCPSRWATRGDSCIHSSGKAVSCPGYSGPGAVVGSSRELALVPPCSEPPRCSKREIHERAGEEDRLSASVTTSAWSQVSNV